jgi:hypothetical protein
MEVFETMGDPAQLIGCDLDTLATKAESEKANLLNRLNELGQTRRVYCLDQVLDLSGGITLAKSAEVPTIQDVHTGARGIVTPSVSYEELGVGTELAGRWREKSPHIADFYLEFECRDSIESNIQVADRITLPAFTNQSIRQQLSVYDGRPALFVFTHPPAPNKEKADGKLTVLRLILTRIQK